MSLLALAACSSFFDAFKEKRKNTPTFSRAAQTERYVQDLASLQLALNKQPSGDTAKSTIKSLNAYEASNKKNKKTISLTVLALEYKPKDGKDKQTLLVPVPSSGGRNQLGSLQKILPVLVSIPHTLYNIRAYEVQVVPEQVSHFPKDDVHAWHQQLQFQQAEMMASSTALPIPDNARLQLDLVRFFTKNNVRDAAYLAQENAKEALAVMAEKMPDRAEDSARLSKEAVALEQTLHEKLPYNL